MERRSDLPRPLPDEDYVRFHAAGETVKGEFHCAECGYGVAICRQLPRCPMCGGSSWEEATWSPFARATESARL